MITGLAYSQMGGSTLTIEVSLASMRKEKRELQISGNIKDVMKESVEIAYSFARNFLKKRGNTFLEK